MFRRNPKTARGPRRSWARVLATFWLALSAATGLAPVSAQSTTRCSADSGPCLLKSAWDVPSHGAPIASICRPASTHGISTTRREPQAGGWSDLTYRFDDSWLGGQWIAGGSLFTNSFGQFSQLVYGGLLWRPLEEHQPFYLKLGAGILHGYSGADPGQEFPAQQHRLCTGDRSGGRLLLGAVTVAKSSC